MKRVKAGIIKKAINIINKDKIRNCISLVINIWKNLKYYLIFFLM